MQQSSKLRPRMWMTQNTTRQQRGEHLNTETNKGRIQLLPPSQRHVKGMTVSSTNIENRTCPFWKCKYGFVNPAFVLLSDARSSPLLSPPLPSPLLCSFLNFPLCINSFSPTLFNVTAVPFFSLSHFLLPFSLPLSLALSLSLSLSFSLSLLSLYLCRPFFSYSEEFSRNETKWFGGDFLWNVYSCV